MDLRLEQVLAAARARRAALTAETAGYLALGVADALAVAPGVVRESDVVVDAEGGVTVSGAARADDPAAAERSVRVLLQKLLAASAGSSPSLSACSRRQPGNGMRALVEELEAALIPVNRAAARRAIGRLAREASKVPAVASEAPRPAPRPVRDAPAAPAPQPAPQPQPEPAAQPAAAARPASDLFEAATEPEYSEQLGVAPGPGATMQPPVDTTPTELGFLEISEHTVPLEIIPAEPSPAPAESLPADQQTSPIEPPPPPPVPDLEVGPIIRRPQPFLEPSPVPPTPAPPTPAPPLPVAELVAPAQTRADPDGLTPQLSTYDPHPAAHLPPPPPASETPGWDDSYAERSKGAAPPARVMPAAQPAPGHVATAQPPDVVSASPEPAPRVVAPTPPSEVPQVPEPSVPIDVVTSATPPPAKLELPEPSVPHALDGATPPPAMVQVPEASVPLELVAGLSPAPAPEQSGRPAEEAGPARPPKADADGVGGVQVSGVDDLLANFASGTKRSPREVAGELKRMVGLEPTPAPPEVATITGASLVSTSAREGDEGARMEPLEFRRPRAPRTALAITTTLLLLMLGVAVALCLYYPQLFTGR